MNKFSVGEIVEHEEEGLVRIVQVDSADEPTHYYRVVHSYDTDGEWFWALESELSSHEQDDPVNHPAHYTYGSIEVSDFIADKGLNFFRGNVVKYVSRAGKKDADTELEDLRKAVWYLEREITRLVEEMQ